MPLEAQNNVATFSLAPGCDKFDAFCAECDYDVDEEFYDPIIADPLEVVSDDEDDAAPQDDQGANDNDYDEMQPDMAAAMRRDDEEIAELESDKATFEFPAEAQGILKWVAMSP